jgi:hypothetical protein
LEPIIEKTVDLFLRLNTQQAELVATVLFTTRELRQQLGRPPTEREVLAAVMQWKQRRRPPLNEAEVALTVRQLAAIRWLDVTPSADLPLVEDSLVAA